MRLRQPPPLFDERVQVATRAQLSHEAHVLRGFERIVDLDDVAISTLLDQMHLFQRPLFHAVRCALFD